MSGTDMARCLINSLPSEKVCVLKSKANDDHWGQQREGERHADTAVQLLYAETECCDIQ